jgi:hypothetical protein
MPSAVQAAPLKAATHVHCMFRARMVCGRTTEAKQCASQPNERRKQTRVHTTHPSALSTPRGKLAPCARNRHTTQNAASLKRTHTLCARRDAQTAPQTCTPAPAHAHARSTQCRQEPMRDAASSQHARRTPLPPRARCRVHAAACWGRTRQMQGAKGARHWGLEQPSVAAQASWQPFGKRNERVRVAAQAASHHANACLTPRNRRASSSDVAALAATTLPVCVGSSPSPLLHCMPRKTDHIQVPAAALACSH